MKKFVLVAGLLITVLSYVQADDSYEIAEIYGVQDVERGTLAITRNSRTEEVEKILTPIRLDTGRYRVSVRRIDSDLYQITGKDIYIKTRYCYEYVYNEEVILEITSSYGYSKGKIYFK
jgi:hypothetical protein